ncbi:MAG: glycosyltransferase family 2 protein [Rhodoglobus sp.]
MLRILVVLTIAAGLNYILWRWTFSLNFDAWWIAIPLVAAETYSLIDVSLFGLTMWRARTRPQSPEAPAGLTVDVFITTYNEDIELVRGTAIAARDITYPHLTWILDDGARDEMRAVADEIGVGYITRGESWRNRPRHAKAGNLNNALMATGGEFMLILDADQVPSKHILDRTLGHFNDEQVALVQTPQEFWNVPAHDPLGSHAPLFYGPLQQGKDGWNAAFFCGSNALLRREALMMLGVTRYVTELEHSVSVALRGADRVIRKARRSSDAAHPATQQALAGVASAVAEARTAIAGRAPIGTVTYNLQRRVDIASRSVVSYDLDELARDLDAIRELQGDDDGDWGSFSDIDAAVHSLASRDLTPLGALESIQALIRSIDVDRDDEAQPLMPLATISVTEDMATSMRLHGIGWKSIYHHETLVWGLAPEDLGTSLTQRLRWAQGTMQVLIRENPLVQKGLSIAQRLMYFSTMWTYLTGYAAIIYFAAPVIFLVFGVLPVTTMAEDFFYHFIPFLVINQVLFLFSSRGMSTWRGQQYSLALFPIWIAATTTAVANVFFGRPLGFVVTSKTKNETGSQWHLVRYQLIVGVVLIIASIIGITRLITGDGEPVGTIVNLAWVVYDIVILSVIIPAVRYRGFAGKEGN